MGPIDSFEGLVYTLNAVRLLFCITISLLINLCYTYLYSGSVKRQRVVLASLRIEAGLCVREALRVMHGALVHART